MTDSDPQWPVGPGHPPPATPTAGADTGLGGPRPPQILQEDGSVVLARAGEWAPIVEVYLDFQCPVCRRFEEVNARTLKEVAEDGVAIVHYRPVSVFAGAPGPAGVNSLRAAAAARAAADHGRFVEYKDLLFANQPPEDAEGFVPLDLRAWGEQVGISNAAFAERVDAENTVAQRWANARRVSVSGPETDESFLTGTYVGEVLDATAAVAERYSGENAFQGTPAVYVDGRLQGEEIFTAQGLSQAIAAAG
ncbi:DsbA family protein [Marinactinospora thermotolerans]|uniref:Protein-disulfide isomerase n=1 Tax=Marinactinospora thermotolerans DSM 45154 TaxID=1122192 RepID=A0A1T4RSV4_9ACTN|nr:DsbA family protein [Marinactinospora thermotolerans]SKA18977.1 Protein-disulfide isomerase [Marinactinospora thermotolerans DSM 45154]